MPCLSKMPWGSLWGAAPLPPELTMSADTTAPKIAKPKGKPRGKPFPKGVSGNPSGRPRGSRHKISEDFVAALGAEFEEHGIAAIQAVRAEDPRAFLKLVADLVAREFGLKHDAGDAFLALWGR